MQAPFDSFVCFHTSFDDCMKHSQGGELATFTATTTKARGSTREHQQSQLIAYTRPHVTGPQHRYAARVRTTLKLPASQGGPEQSITTPESTATPTLAAELEGVFFRDSDANATRTTQDKKYKCGYGEVPYAQKLDVKRTTDAVFVSPVLIRQIGEEVLRLQQVRLACDRLIEQYDTDVKLTAAQDLLMKFQRAVADLSAYAENARVARELRKGAPPKGATLGDDTIDPEDATMYGIEGTPSTADALLLSRSNVSNASESLRTIQKTQVLDVEYSVKFDQVQIAIDLQSRVVARMLFLLDRSVPDSDIYNSNTVDPKYLTGAWVKQGTVVFDARQK